MGLSDMFEFNHFKRRLIEEEATIATYPGTVRTRKAHEKSVTFKTATTGIVVDAKPCSITYQETSLRPSQLGYISLQ